MSSTKKKGLGSVDGRDQNERSQSAPRAPAPLRRVTIGDLQKMKKKDLPITMLTAYDYPSAVHADLAHVDVVLVGDSLGMVVLGHDTTQTVRTEKKKFGRERRNEEKKQKQLGSVCIRSLSRLDITPPRNTPHTSFPNPPSPLPMSEKHRSR